MPAALAIVAEIITLAQQGAPVVEEAWQALSQVRAAASEGRDLTSAELDALDAAREAALAKLDADIKARS